MSKSGEFDNILNECLERMLVNGEPIEQCLVSYPELADQLRPLLQTALAARQASAIQPRPDFRARARYQLNSELQAMETKRSRPSLGWQPRWVTAIATVLILLLVGGGTAAAAGYSMPDEPLYPVKLATEQVWLALTPSDIGKAQLSAKLADRRVAEIVYLAKQDEPEQIELTAQRLNTHLAKVAALAAAPEEEASVLMAPSPAAEEAPAPPGVTRGDKGDKQPQAQANRRAKLRAAVAGYAANHTAVLREVLETAPESVKPALRRAIAISVAGYDNALKKLD